MFKSRGTITADVAVNVLLGKCKAELKLCFATSQCAEILGKRADRIHE